MARNPTTHNNRQAPGPAIRFSSLVLMIAAFAAVQGQPLDQDNVAVQVQADVENALSQERVNELDDQTRESAAEYAQAMEELDSLNQYNAQLQEQVESQEKEKASLTGQLAEIETTNREILPLMERMVSTLAAFVAADVPFLQEEREKRITALQEMMPRADIAISEKYRRILEAYQIELEYGNTLEAYEGKLESEAGQRLVELVRLGRISLMYQTLDAAESGYWNADQGRWVRDDSYVQDISRALSVAREEGAPDLIRVPVPAAKGVEP